MASRITIILMRHLPTVGNEKRQYIGWTDEPIVQDSIKKLEIPWNPSVVKGSDLLRTKQSAAIYFPDAEFIGDSRWREANFGKWEQSTYAELKDDLHYRRWIQDPFTYTPPEGESFLKVKERVLSAFGELTDLEEIKCIVTHGGPIRILLHKFSPTPKEFWSWEIPHGSAWKFIWENVKDFKEGKRCTYLSVEPIMEKGSM